MQFNKVHYHESRKGGGCLKRDSLFSYIGDRKKDFNSIPKVGLKNVFFIFCPVAMIKEIPRCAVDGILSIRRVVLLTEGDGCGHV